MPRRILQAIVGVEEEAEQRPHVQSEESPSQDHEDVEGRLRTILGSAIQSKPPSPPGHANRHAGLPLSQLPNPIHPIPRVTRANTPEGADCSGLPYLNNRLYVKRQDSPPNSLELESHFNEAYKASLAAAAAAAPAPPSSPLSRWFGDLTTTPPPESEDEDEDTGDMREADERDSNSGSDSDDSSDWWDDEEPESASTAVQAPAPHQVLPINIRRIEVSALQYTPPASPVQVGREMEVVLMPSPMPRPRALPVMAAPTRTPPPPPLLPACRCGGGEDSRVYIKKEGHSSTPPSPCGEDSEMSIRKEEDDEEDVSSPLPLPLLRRYSRLRIEQEEEEEEEVMSSSTMYESSSEYSAIKEEEEEADAVKTEVMMEEIQVAVKVEVKGAVKVEIRPKVTPEVKVEASPEIKFEELTISTPAPPPVLVTAPAPAPASDSTVGAEPVVRKRSRSGWTSINGPGAKRRKYMH